jgi:hypothetical protein
LIEAGDGERKEASVWKALCDSLNASWRNAFEKAERKLVKYDDVLKGTDEAKWGAKKKEFLTANSSVSKDFLDGRRAILAMDEGSLVQGFLKRRGEALLEKKVLLYAAGDFLSRQAFLGGRNAGKFLSTMGSKVATKAYSLVRPGDKSVKEEKIKKSRLKSE